MKRFNVKFSDYSISRLDELVSYYRPDFVSQYGDENFAVLKRLVDEMKCNIKLESQFGIQVEYLLDKSEMAVIRFAHDSLLRNFLQ